MVTETSLSLCVLCNIRDVWTGVSSNEFTRFITEASMVYFPLPSVVPPHEIPFTGSRECNQILLQWYRSQEYFGGGGLFYVHFALMKEGLFQFL